MPFIKKFPYLWVALVQEGFTIKDILYPDNLFVLMKRVADELGTYLYLADDMDESLDRLNNLLKEKYTNESN